MIRPLWIAAFVAAFAAPLHASIVTENGWQNAAVPSAPAGSFTGGLDVLPNGHVLLFDGAALVEIDGATGQVVATLYTPPAAVFGSFVRIDPTGTYALFGESSGQTITKVPLDGSPTSLVATIPFNFDCVFQDATHAFVSHSDATFSRTMIERLDVVGGATDLIADLNGPSGPLALDAAGNLYHGENSATFPAPTGQQRLLVLSAAALASAIGPTFLGDVDVSVFAPGFTAPFGMAFDEEGDLFVTDSLDGVLREVDPQGNAKATVGAEAPFTSVGYLAFRGNGHASKARMGAFQPDDGGVLYATSTDFFSFNDLNVVRPERAFFEVTPANPVPAGPVTLTLRRGPPVGMMHLYIAGSGLSPEVPIVSAGVPLFFGIDPARVGLLAIVPLDANGEFMTSGTHAGGAGSGVIQGVMLDTAGHALGTSQPLTLLLL